MTQWECNVKLIKEKSREKFSLCCRAKQSGERHQSWLQGSESCLKALLLTVGCEPVVAAEGGRSLLH